MLGVLLILFSVALFNTTPAPDTSKYALPAAHDPAHPFVAGDVDRVEIKRKDETLVFVRTDPKTDHWEIDQPRKLRAGPAVKTLVAEVIDAVRDPEADVPANAQRAGLEPPVAVVTLTHTKKADDKDEDRSLQLNVGAASSESSRAVIYVSSADHPGDVVPVRRSNLSTVLDTLNDFREPNLLASATSDYTRIKLLQGAADKDKPHKGPLQLTKMEGGLWRYADPAGYDGSAEMGAPGALTQPGKPPSGVDGLLRVLSDLQAKPTDWVEDGGPELLTKADYGLDPARPDVMTVEVERVLTAKDDSGAEKKEETRGTTTMFVALGKKVGDKADRYYAAVQDGIHATSVVRIPTAGVDAAALEFQDPSALCSKTLVALGGVKKPLAVRVASEAGKPPLEFLRLKDTDPWRFFRDGKEVTADQHAIEMLINQLVQPEQVRSFVNAPDDAKLGLTKDSPVVEVWVDGVEEEKKPENKDEKKDDKKDEKKDEPKPRLLLKSDKPAARLTYGAVEGDLAAIKRYADHGSWTESAVVQAPKLLEEQAKAGLLTYYDKALPKYAATFDLPDKDVFEVEIDRPDGAYVVSRYNATAVLGAATGGLLDSSLGQGPFLAACTLDPTRLRLASPWVFKQPADWDQDHRKTKVNAAQVEEVLGRLLSMQATSLVVETPTPDELDKYGLKSPAFKAVITKKSGDKTETYTYAFGKDAPDGGVYAQQSQRPMVFVVNKDILTTLNQDLRDRSVFAVDPAKREGG